MYYDTLSVSRKKEIHAIVEKLLIGITHEGGDLELPIRADIVFKQLGFTLYSALFASPHTEAELHQNSEKKIYLAQQANRTQASEYTFKLLAMHALWPEKSYIQLSSTLNPGIQDTINYCVETFKVPNQLLIEFLNLTQSETELAYIFNVPKEVISNRIHMV